MSNRMDQLFKNKLGDHRTPPSAEAWSKVEAGLVKKNNTVILWRAAAVFVLFGLLTAAWFWQSAKDETHEVATQEVDSNPATKEVLVPKVIEEKENNPPVAVVEKSTENKSAKPKGKSDTQNKPVEQIPAENLVIEKVELIADTEKIVAPVLKAEKPIVIEFTLDPVGNNATQVAQVVVEKSTGLVKILEKARDIKNGDSDLGGLRDAKNELFALDFRKDKTKRN